MDDTLLFIPPCCVDKKLPKAIMEAPRRTLTFYTHGDVPMEKFYRAIAYLLGNTPVMALTMPTFTQQTAGFLRQCFDRGWITDLILTTNTDKSQLLQKYLTNYSTHVLYTSSDTITDISSHFVLYSNNQALILTGPMWETGSKQYTLVTYTLTYYPQYPVRNTADWGNALRNVLLPDVLLHRKESYAKTQIKGNLYSYLKLDFPPYKEEKQAPTDPHGVMI